jgi:hypothetical protein
LFHVKQFQGDGGAVADPTARSIFGVHNRHKAVVTFGRALRPAVSVAGAEANKATNEKIGKATSAMPIPAPRIWRAIAFLARVDIVLLLAMILVGLAVRLT